ncbi:serine protease [Embleya sp. NBC_00888]|uniref:trypsin-like serine peptidase n=1 Tax=Embleya sp. NBC_00888 TaxID=2975960 RepID=UPI0038691F61|nr:serine protease [Embleya sp. NBC_00888]
MSRRTPDVQATPGRRRVVIGALFCVVAVLVVAGLASTGRISGHPRSRGTGDASRGYHLPDPAEGDRIAASLLGGAPAGPSTELSSSPVPTESSSQVEPLPTSDPLEAAPIAATPAIGALLHVADGEDPEHFCTASVVRSPNRNLVVTAAHCVFGDAFASDIAFAPGYHDGVMPYGAWVLSRIDVDPRWVADRDPDYDVAFLQVRRPGTDDRIEAITGAEQVDFDSAPARPARLIGYPDGEDQPIGCQNTTSAYSDTQLRFDCAGFPNGTSGGPMLTEIDPANGRGTVIGVIGGYQEGGDDLTSYSSYFGPDIAALYDRARTAEVSPTT